MSKAATLKKNNYEGLSQALFSVDGWTVLGHSIPDGDCIGSVTALGLALESLGIKVSLVVEDGVPAMYRFLAGTQSIHSVEDLPQIYAGRIYVDCATAERIGDKLLPILPPGSITINIDHHVSNSMFGDINLVDPESSSTCEILLQVLAGLGVAIDQDIASSIFCGLVMDTGSFQYSNTSPATLRAAADLLEAGIDLDRIRTGLFESKSRTEMEVIKLALGSLQYTHQGRVAWLELSCQELLRIGSANLHFEGVINLARNVEGVEVALLFREIEPGLVKVGFRSKDKTDVNRIASIWGGGGHRKAAGATLHGSLAEVKDLVLTAVAGEMA